MTEDLRVGLRVGSESGNTSEVYAGGVCGPLYFVVKVSFSDTDESTTAVARMKDSTDTGFEGD